MPLFDKFAAALPFDAFLDRYGSAAHRDRWHNVLQQVTLTPEQQKLIARAKRGDICVSLDVFDPEPIPAGSEIRDLTNVFLTPHIAGVTAACRPRFFDFMVDELERLFGGDETMFDLTPRVLANRRGLAPA